MNYGPKSHFLVIAGRDVTARHFTLNPREEQILEECRPFGATGTMEKHRPIGVGKLALEAGGGIYDDAAGGMVDAVQSLGQTSQRVVFGLAGSAVGAVVTLLEGVFAFGWERAQDRGALLKGNPKYTVTGQRHQGRLLHGLTAETADGDTLAAAAPKGGVDRALDGAPAPVTIVTSSIANPTVITTLTDHGLVTGDVVVISGHTSVTPTIDGDRVVTVTGLKTFTIPVDVSADGVGGTVQRMTRVGAVAITSNSIANPTVVTCPVAHGLITGDVVIISGVATSDPSINGQQTVTAIDATTFSVPVNVTTGGTGGRFVKVTSTGCVVDLHVVYPLTLGGHTGILVTVLDSPDDDTYSSLQAFTSAAAIGTERKTVTGDVQRFTAVQWDFEGAGSDPSAKPLVAIAR